ncbi:MAG: M48 family metallopeptidase [Pseudomonadales bacterium]|nr:M48 family metallopeptidase [Pseudomonadales bacterium]
MIYTLPNGIEYLIQFSNKRLPLSIQINFQDVIVKAPAGIKPSTIHEFVISKQTWIKRKLTNTLPDIVFNTYSQNGFVWYMGKQYQIKCDTQQHNIGILTENTITLKAREYDNQNIQQQYLKWLQHQAKRMMPDLVDHCLSRFPIQYKVNVKAITCKRTKSKWGHCTHDQKLQFNWIILMAPPHILEYLICHEIAHLAQKNHSKKFWALVDSLCDHTKKAEQWLKKNAEVLMQA